MQHPFLERRFLAFFIPVILGIFLLAFYRGVLAAPRVFPSGSIISVRSGAGLLEVSQQLKADGAIRSPFWFRTFAILIGGERDLRAGEYYLSEPQNVFSMARRIAKGKHDVEIAKITIPEGFTSKKIASLFDERFPFFDKQEFLASAPEGYLFPDTYFVPVTATASSTIKLLRDHFIRKIFPIMPEIEKSGRSLEEIVIMASILEGEARTPEDMQIVSSILWKRLNAGMPLQVDTTFVYLLGKATKDLTLDDLKVDSPYNTYLYKGLPPGPVSNPGLASILAAANPTTTPYMYFLTGNDGKMYYARTFDEHVQNKQKYLSNRE